MSTNKNKSALQENKGIEQPKIINAAGYVRKNKISIEKYVSEIQKGNRVYLSKAITLIESTSEKHKEKANAILKACLQIKTRSTRIGITGVPGVGKSTFIEAFGLYLTAKGKKVAILAVDPSSSVTKGSILGDKTRMEELVRDENAFIRLLSSRSPLFQNPNVYLMGMNDDEDYIEMIHFGKGEKVEKGTSMYEQVKTFLKKNL